jgi:hypothetical protein
MKLSQNRDSAPLPAERRTPSIENLSFDKNTLPPLDRTLLPKEFLDPVKVIGGARWIDANGENTLVIEERIRDDGEYERVQEIMAYTYITRQSERPKFLWKIYDIARNPCDQGEGLISNVDVRDLNNDGIAENTFIYNIAGACDVSPIQFKLMLHSGGKKYAIRGTNKVKPGEDSDWMGGEKNFDPAFASAPQEFREHASEIWNRYVEARTVKP